MIQKMDKIQVIGPRAVLTDVSSKVYEFGKVHINEVSYSMLDVEGKSDFSLKDVKLNEGELKDIARLEELFGRIDSTIGYLQDEVAPQYLKSQVSASGEETQLSDSMRKKNSQELSSLVSKIETQLEDIKARREDVKKVHGQVMGFGKIVETFAGLMEQAHDLDKLEMVGFSTTKQAGVMELVKDTLAKLTDNEYEIFTADLDKKSLGVVIAAPKEKMAHIKELFALEGVKDLPFPDEYSDKPLQEVLETLKNKQGDMPADAEAANKQLIAFAERYYGLLKKIRQQAKDALRVYGEVPKFAESKFTFVMQGWIPKDDVAAFKEFLKGSYGDTVIVEELPVSHSEYHKVPVVLKNNKYTRRFEMCLSLFGPPLYGGVDPTLFLSIFFPFIYGMILGDIAYGAIIMVVALLIRKVAKTESIDNVGFMLAMCALSTIIWGFLYGEVMGTLGHFFGLKPLIVNREHIPGMMAPLTLTVGFGAFHILLALGIKVVDSYKHTKSFNDHALEAASLMTIIVAAVGIILSKLGYLPEGLFMPLVGVIVLAWVVVFKCGGIGAGLEVFGMFGNILSYARIMAIGLQSVIMAMVANIIAVKAPVAAIGIGICVLVHIINIVLGMVGPIIHGLRLHFVETFGKFVKLEGAEYKPFAKKGGE